MYFATAGSSLSPGHISSFNIAQTLVFQMGKRLAKHHFVSSRFLVKMLIILAPYGIF